MSVVGQFHQFRMGIIAHLAPWRRRKLEEVAAEERQPVMPPAPEPLETVTAAASRAPPVPRPSSGSTVDPKSSGYATCDALTRAAGPAILAAYEKHLAALGFRVGKEWPVYSGFSGSHVDLRYRAHDGLVIGELAATASYASLMGYQVIKRRDGTERKAKGNPWRQVVIPAQASTVAAVQAAIGPEIQLYARGVKRV
jgi:hypothetical protein